MRDALTNPRKIRAAIARLAERPAGSPVVHEATFVSWRTTAHGGKKKSRKGEKR